MGNPVKYERDFYRTPINSSATTSATSTDDEEDVNEEIIPDVLDNPFLSNIVIIRQFHEVHSVNDDFNLNYEHVICDIITNQNQDDINCRIAELIEFKQDDFSYLDDLIRESIRSSNSDTLSLILDTTTGSIAWTYVQENIAKYASMACKYGTVDHLVIIEGIAEDFVHMCNEAAIHESPYFMATLYDRTDCKNWLSSRNISVSGFIPHFTSDLPDL